MKTFLAGYLLGVLTVIAFLTRARWLPWARTEEQKIVDALAKKDSTPSDQGQP